MRSAIYIDTVRIQYNRDIIKIGEIRAKVIDALKTINGLEVLIVSDEEIIL